MTNLMRASNEWWRRPDDQRFTDPYLLRDSVLSRRKSSEVEVLDVSDLQVTGSLKDITPGSEEQEKRITVNAPTSLHNWVELSPTHWSFGQLCQKADAPSTYIRKLH